MAFCGKSHWLYSFAMLWLYNSVFRIAAAESEPLCQGLVNVLAELFEKHQSGVILLYYYAEH